MLIKALIHTSVTDLLFDICEGTKNKVEGILLKKNRKFLHLLAFNFHSSWTSRQVEVMTPDDYKMK
jgi:hypothetical protein